jgi:hypothetical protein
MRPVDRRYTPRVQARIPGISGIKFTARSPWAIAYAVSYAADGLPMKLWDLLAIVILFQDPMRFVVRVLYAGLY